MWEKGWLLGLCLKGFWGVSCHAQEPAETFQSSLEDIFPLPFSLSLLVS